jgi:hypothetical protein
MQVKYCPALMDVAVVASTVSVAAMVPAAYTDVASCEAVMVVLPIPTTVTAPVVEFTVATEVFELV